mgnify:CR=1 FL=1
MNKTGLINHILTNGRTKTWQELANDFEIGEGLTNEQKAKKANDIWRAYIKKENTKEFSKIKISMMNKISLLLFLFFSDF